MRQGLKRVAFLADPTSGHLRVGCPEITMAGLMPAIVEQFSRRYPGIRLHVALVNVAMLQLKDLRERNIELIVGRMPQPFVADDLAAEILFDEPFMAVAGVSTPWARRRKIALADLVGERWVLPPYDSAPGALIAKIFRANMLTPPAPGIETLSVQLTVMLIESGRFIGLLPSSVAHFNARRGGLKVLPVKLPTVRLAASVITVKGRTISPLAELFIGCARETARSTRIDALD
jgi:DNA-binding transcriptional LysR family regulator